MDIRGRPSMDLADAMTVQGQAWQIAPRFEPVVDGLLRRADLRGGERVLDLGTGTGAVAAKAAATVADDGLVLAVDISPEMLDCARHGPSAAVLDSRCAREQPRLFPPVRTPSMSFWPRCR